MEKHIKNSPTIQSSATIICLAILLVVLIPSISALDYLGEFEKDSCVEIKQTCATCGYVNISISLPNSTRLLNDVAMVNSGAGVWTYNFCNTTLLDRYEVNGKGDLNGDDTSFATYFIITPTGRTFSGGQGVVSVGILIGALGLGFFFMFLGMKIKGDDSNIGSFMIGLLFIIISLFLGIYSLHLSYAFTSDIMQYESLSPVTEVMYITILWLIVGVVIITMSLMLVAFIKELGKMNKKRSYGEGFNPVTDTYDF